MPTDPASARADAAFSDPKKRAAWLDPSTRGLFCRIADAGHRIDDLEAEFGPVDTGKDWPGMRTWEEVVTVCRRVALGVENVAAEAGARTIDIKVHREVSPEIVRDLMLSGLTAGEIVTTISAELDVLLRAMTARALLVCEMRSVVLEASRMWRCGFCTGWHAVLRAPAGDVSYCNAACRNAAHAERSKVKT